MEIRFHPRYPWAILPRKLKIDVQSKEEEIRLMDEHFRWIRQNRSAEVCWPWRMAQETGWIIDSPVTVDMEALGDLEVYHSEPADSAFFQEITGSNLAWGRPGDPEQVKHHIIARRGGWMRLYDFVSDQGWKSMFQPNGKGTVEWTLGWKVHIPPGYYLMLMPYERIPNLEVETGFLDHKTLERMNGEFGVPIAVRPTGPVSIRRGQPVAKIMLLHPDTLRAQMKVSDEPFTGAEVGGGTK